jgi:hypothetical protein
MSAMLSQVDGDDASLSRGGSSGALRDQSGQERPLDVLRRVPGNDACADCGAADPDWASLNLGILLCIECSGVHRNMSVQVSKVGNILLCLFPVDLKSIDMLGVSNLNFLLLICFSIRLFNYLGRSTSPNCIRGVL